MFKRSAILLAATAMLTVAAAPYKPVNVTTPPVIDGKLDDACWKSVPVLNKFTRINDSNRQAAERKTEVKIVYTDTAVVFGIKNFVPQDKRREKEDPEVALFRHDCVEVMLSPSSSVDTYYHFIINCFNRAYEGYREQGGHVANADWTCTYKSAVQRSKDYWTLEFELPYASLELTSAKADTWRLNVMRSSFNVGSNQQEISSLTGAGHNSSLFPAIQSPRKNLTEYCWNFATPASASEMRDGKQLLLMKSMIENLTGVNRNIVCEVRLTHEKGGRSSRSRTVLKLDANKKTAVEFAPAVLPRSGRYQGRLTLRDQASNRVVSQKFFNCIADFTPMLITFTDPHYRDMIFESQKLDKVRGSIKLGSVTPGSKVKVAIRKNGENKPIAEQQFDGSKTINFEFDNAKLPYGRLEIYAVATAKDGKVLAETTRKLRKLEYKPWEMYRGKDGVWRRGGKRIFIMGLWNGGDANYAPAEFNVNMIGSNHPGQLVFNHIFGGKLTAQMRREGISESVRNQFRDRILKHIDDPQVMMHYFIDEPDCGGQSAEVMANLARYLADVDPHRPLVISTATSGCTAFMECAEFNGFHTYHRTILGVKMANFSKMGLYLDRWRAAYDAASNLGKQDVLWMHQGFCYGDSGLPESRIPSFDEFRNQNIYALTVGACGILQYNRNEEQFPELGVGVAPLAKELSVIGNEAIIQDASPVKPVCSDKDLRMLAKYNPNTGDYWLLLASSSDNTKTFTIDFAPFTGKKIQVLSENRFVEFKNGKFTAEFTPWHVMVLTTSNKDFKLRTVKSINDEIEAIYAKRAKAGNLAYQRFEGTVVDVYASSNLFKRVNNNCALWHLADGVTEGTPCVSTHRSGVIASQDATPNKTPDWVELIFKKPVTAGRVVVYPALDSLKDYEVQVEVDGKYVTVSKVANAKGLAQEHKFAPVKTNKVRVFVNANRGAYTRIYEVEVYEK